MDATEQTINTFATRVRQMILQYNELKQENDRLYAMVDEKDAQVRQLEVRLAPVSYTHLTLPTKLEWCRSRWSPYH